VEGPILVVNKADGDKEVYTYICLYLRAYGNIKPINIYKFTGR